MFTLSAFKDKPTYSISVFVRTVSGYKLGKTWKKTASGKIKASEFFSGKETCYLPSVCKYIHYIST